MSKGAAFVVGDAAVTRPRGAVFATGDYSSFLEPHINNHRHNIEERVLKVAPVGNRILGVAGDTALCAQATQLFAQHPEQYAEDFFLAVEASLLPTAKSFQLLVAEQGRVVCWDSETRKRSHDDFAAIGHLSPELGDTLFKVANWAFHLDLEPKDFLAVLQGAYQSLVIRNALMAEHVGGAVMGAFVDSAGVHWLSDTMFALLDPGLMGDPFAQEIQIPDLNLVHLIARNRVAFAAPVLVNGKLGIKVLPGVDLSVEDIERTIAEVRSEVLDAFARARADHWVFISRTSSLVLVMRGGVEVMSDGRLRLDRQVAAQVFALHSSLPTDTREVSLFVAAPNPQGGLLMRGLFISTLHDEAMKVAGLVPNGSKP